MLLDIIILSFIIAFLRGGRSKDIPKFNQILFLVISVALQLCSIFLHQGIGNILTSIAYLSALFFLYSNREWEDMRIIIIGWMLNSLTILANWGRMPIDLEQAKKTPFDVTALINGTDWKHALINSSTRLPFLSDIIYLPYPVPRVISIGDIFIALGVFLLVQRLLKKPISLKMLHEGKINVTK
jgi:ABC-type enterobactin transport system permease subunit